MIYKKDVYNIKIIINNMVVKQNYYYMNLLIVINKMDNNKINIKQNKI